MFKPKEQIFNALIDLGYSCQQGAQAVFNEVPAITFRIENNAVNLDLDNEIASQDVTAVVDVWANESDTASGILSEVEAKMRSIGYRLSYSADVPAPEGALHHVTSRFESIK